jgi:hypothetical protein
MEATLPKASRLTAMRQAARSNSAVSSGNPPRKHHYLPVFYTKWWAGPDGRVERFSKHGDTIVDRRVSPSRVGWQKDLYRIPQTAPGYEQAIEQLFFKDLDNKAALALWTMNRATRSTRKPLSQLEVSAWATFMMSLFHRSPEYLADVKRAGQRLWLQPSDPDLEAKYAALRGTEDPATYEEYVASRDPKEAEIDTLWNLPHLIANPRIGEVLVRLPWVWFDVPTDCPELLLSDHPLLRTNGLRKPDGHLAIPLSPRRFLLVAANDDIRRKIDQTPVKELVKALNRHTVQNARRFVVASDLKQARFIRKHFGSDPRPSLSAGVAT